LRAQGEIGPGAGHPQVGQCRRLPHAVDLIEGEQAGPDRGRRVVVAHVSVAVGQARVDERALDRSHFVTRSAADGDRPAVAVPLAGRVVEVVFEPPESGQYVGEGPAVVAGRRPCVVARRVSPQRHHVVGGRAAADDASGKQRYVAPQGGRRPGVMPVEVGGAGVLGVEDVTGVRMSVCAEVGTSLDEQHRSGPVFGQPGRDDPARRAGADDDDICVCVVRRGHASSLAISWVHFQTY
jgi:hypothetical protein